jgi:nucleoside-diphosphate-sugar epimerase
MKYGKEGMIKKAIVIGASGFAGRHLVAALIDEGVEVFAVEHRNLLTGIDGRHVIKGGVKAVSRNLIDEIRPEVIFHLARPSFPRLRKAGRLLAGRYAAFLNKRLLREIAHAQCMPRLIFASGSLMYGSSPLPSDETAPLRPYSYARQYYRGEMPVVHSIKAGLFPVMVVRMPWLLGQGSWFEWFYLRTMRQQKAIPLFGNGENKMEIIDVTDAARLLIRIAHTSLPPGVYNVISSGAVSQLEFAGKLATLSGLPVKDHRELFPAGLEQEAFEAFTSNIELTTKFPEIFDGFEFTSLDEAIIRITRK